MSEKDLSQRGRTDGSTDGRAGAEEAGGQGWGQRPGVGARLDCQNWDLRARVGAARAAMKVRRFIEFPCGAVLLYLSVQFFTVRYKLFSDAKAASWFIPPSTLRFQRLKCKITQSAWCSGGISLTHYPILVYSPQLTKMILL